MERQRINLLVVEDNSDDFFFLQRVLKSSEEIDAVIFHEERLEPAVALAAREAVDAAIVDLSLPDSFGLETFIAFHERHPTTWLSGRSRQAPRTICSKAIPPPAPSSAPFAMPSSGSS